MVKTVSLPQVRINDRAAKRLHGGHLWVYASDVTDEGGAKPGALVHVLGPGGRPLGSALYSSASQIKLRLLTRELLGSEDDFLEMVRHRIEAAVSYRSGIVENSEAYRVVFSEADLLPGLIVDRYKDITTLQVLTQAWDQPSRREALIAALREFAPTENLVEREDARIRTLEELPPRASGMVCGDKSTTVFTMNGVRFHCDVLSGQKTGAFLDQRENYAAAARRAHGDALDVCTYQGGFALHLARKCDHVTALDISRESLEIAEQNEQLNAGTHKNEIEWIEANAFDLLKDYANAGKQYDIIVLDPPAFAKSKKNLPTAMRGYKELNLRALRMLRSGGILVTCSCSFAVGEEDFLEMLTAAAQDTHRSVRVLERRAQAQDHPILLGVPETHYLKCVVCSVD